MKKRELVWAPIMIQVLISASVLMSSPEALLSDCCWMDERA